MNYLYHMVPKRIVGGRLVPLEMLREEELYRIYAEKYKGREHVMSHKIPSLRCLSNQVINFTAVHPLKIDAALKRAGFDGLLKRRWFKVDPRLLNIDKTTIFLYKNGINFEDEDNYEKYTIENLNKYNSIGEKTIKYYKQRFHEGLRPLLFHFIPHILYKGTLSVKNLDVIEV